MIGRMMRKVAGRMTMPKPFGATVAKTNGSPGINHENDHSGESLDHHDDHHHHHQVKAF